jgi:alcohol dehydrogenase
MKAVQITDYGAKVQVVDGVEKPDLELDRVLVDVNAAALNPFDVKLSEGFYGDGLSIELPAIPGGDVAGIVAELGADVTGFNVGDAVYGSANAAGGHGSLAEFTVVKASQLYKKPANTDFAQAAALPLVAVSAYQAIVDHMNLQADQKILVHGGAGGIGSIAIQIAKHVGAYVATTTAAKDTEFVNNLGADEVIDYKSQDFSQIIRDYDAVFDTVGGETNLKSYKVVKAGGSFVSMLEAPNAELVKKNSINYVQQASQTTSERLAKITELVEAGVLEVHIDKLFSLDDAAIAFEHLKSGHPRGKVVIQIKAE